MLCGWLLLGVTKQCKELELVDILLLRRERSALAARGGGVESGKSRSVGAKTLVLGQTWFEEGEQQKEEEEDFFGL